MKTAQQRQDGEAIGRRFHEEQVRLGLSSRQIAEASGYTAGHVISLRHGHAFMRAAFLTQLDRLGFDVLYIVTGRRGGTA